MKIADFVTSYEKEVERFNNCITIAGNLWVSYTIMLTFLNFGLISNQNFYKKRDPEMNQNTIFIIVKLNLKFLPLRINFLFLQIAFLFGCFEFNFDLYFFNKEKFLFCFLQKWFYGLSHTRPYVCYYWITILWHTC